MKMKTTSANKYGERAMCVTLYQIFPPIGFSAGAASACSLHSVGKKRTHCAAISDIAADMRQKTPVLNRSTKNVGTSGPRIAPNEPPTAMKPKRRLPCSAVKRSVMNAQKSVVAKRLKTLTQTKKERARSHCHCGETTRMSRKKMKRFAIAKR